MEGVFSIQTSEDSNPEMKWTDYYEEFAFSTSGSKSESPQSTTTTMHDDIDAEKLSFSFQNGNQKLYVYNFNEAEFIEKSELTQQEQISVQEDNNFEVEESDIVVVKSLKRQDDEKHKDNEESEEEEDEESEEEEDEESEDDEENEESKDDKENEESKEAEMDYEQESQQNDECEQEEEELEGEKEFEQAEKIQYGKKLEINSRQKKNRTFIPGKIYKSRVKRQSGQRGSRKVPQTALLTQNHRELQNKPKKKYRSKELKTVGKYKCPKEDCNFTDAWTDNYNDFRKAKDRIANHALTNHEFSGQPKKLSPKHILHRTQGDKKFFVCPTCGAHCTYDHIQHERNMGRPLRVHFAECLIFRQNK